MSIKRILLSAAAILAAGTIVAEAQQVMPPPGNDPGGYYSQYDRDGYYDRNGRYRRIRHRDFDGPPPPPLRRLMGRHRLRPARSIMSVAGTRPIAIAATRPRVPSSGPWPAA